MYPKTTPWCDITAREAYQIDTATECTRWVDIHSMLMKYRSQGSHRLMIYTVFCVGTISIVNSSVLDVREQTKLHSV